MAQRYRDPYESDQESRQSGFWGAERVRPSDASGSLADSDATERYRYQDRQMRTDEPDYRGGRYRESARPYSGRSLSQEDLERYYGRSESGGGRQYEWDSRDQDWGRSGEDQSRYGRREFSGTDRDYDWRSARQGARGREAAPFNREREEYLSYGESSSSTSRSPGYSNSGSYQSAGWRSPYGERETAGGVSYRGKGPKGYTRSDDRLKEMICERLTDDENIDPSNVSLEVADGVVTLEGTVDSRQAKFDIEECAERCGAKDVMNNLKIQRAGSTGMEAGSSMGTSGTGSYGKSGTGKSGSTKGQNH